MLVSAFFLAIMGALTKVLAAKFPTIEVMFFRNILGVVLLLALMLKNPVQQTGGKPFLLIFRALIGVVAILAFFYNIATISLAEAVAYSKMSPVFTAIFAMWFLREKITTKGWIAIAASFMGMLLVMKPIYFSFNHNHLFGIINAVCAALAFTSIRELKNHYDIRIIVFVFMLTGVIVSLIAMIVSNYYRNALNLSFIMGRFVVPENIDWLYILGIGISALLGQIYLTKAYSQTQAAAVAVASYSVIIFAVIIGIVLGDNLPDLYSAVGIVTIIFGGALMANDDKRMHSK